MTDKLITADASKVSGAAFARSLGLNIRTKAEREAEWRADCERYANFIETGDDWAVPPPYLAAARKIAAERGFQAAVDKALKLQQLTETAADPLKHLEPRKAA